MAIIRKFTLAHCRAVTECAFSFDRAWHCAADFGDATRVLQMRLVVAETDPLADLDTHALPALSEMISPLAPEQNSQPSPNLGMLRL